MKNPEGRGILCDYCGVEASDDFTYYSFDFYQVAVSNWQKTVSQEVAFSVDLCEQCMVIYRERVQSAYSPPANNRFNCELSGEVITTPSFTFYRCVISKVDVNLSNAPYTCVDCSAVREPGSGPCEKCTPDTKLIRTADLKVDDKYLDINLSSKMFDKFKAHVEFVKTGENDG
jgi:hypothetical protein